MKDPLNHIINQISNPIESLSFRETCRTQLNKEGVLVLPGFLRNSAVTAIQKEGDELESLAYYTANNHNVYLAPYDPVFPATHARNREVVSSKGCLTTDQFPPDSLLHQLYDAPKFRDFLCAVLSEHELHEYADPLSSINLHFAADGQELGWHFDNSSFAITLLIQQPQQGGQFQYVRDVRDADAGEMSFQLTTEILDGEIEVEELAMDPGSLVLFRGRNSIHRVTPTQGDITRLLVVLAYNATPGVALSESASRTFYGRYSPV